MIWEFQADSMAGHRMREWLTGVRIWLLGVGIFTNRQQEGMRNLRRQRIRQQRIVSLENKALK
jgi:hypothetical protein